MIYFNNRNGSSGLTCRLILRLISATAIYGRWNSSLCWKGRWYPTTTFFCGIAFRIIVHYIFVVFSNSFLFPLVSLWYIVALVFVQLKEQPTFAGFRSHPSCWPLTEHLPIMTLRSVVWVLHWFVFVFKTFHG